MLQMSKRQWIVLGSALFCALAAGGFLIWQKFQAAGNDGVPITLSASGFIYGNKYCGADSATMALHTTDANNKQISQVYTATSGQTSTIDQWCVDASGKDAYQDLTNRPVTVGNGTTPITIVTWGTVKVPSMVINNAATVTHAPLFSHYFSTATNTVFDGVPGYTSAGTEQDYYSDGTLTTSGSPKVVDIQTDGAFQIKDGGKIDVTGMGYESGPSGGKTSDLAHYPSGYMCNPKSQSIIEMINAGVGTNVYQCNLQDGVISGRDSGTGSDNSAAMTVYGFGGGGDSSVAEGGKALSYASGAYSLDSPNTHLATLPHGGGGGMAFAGTTYTISSVAEINARHGAGGGSIKVHAGTINISRYAEIHANGNPGYSGVDHNQMPTGGGAGGTIDIKADTNIFSWPSTITDPVVSAGVSHPILFNPNISAENSVIDNKSYSGAAGLLTSSAPTTTHFGNLITAKGGDDAVSACTHCGTGGTPDAFGWSGSGGASGAGGSVTIQAVGYQALCEISARTYASDPNSRAIPDACGVNSDVILDATGYVDPTAAAGEQPAWIGPSGEVCHVANASDLAKYSPTSDHAAGKFYVTDSSIPCVPNTYTVAQDVHTDDTFTIVLKPGVHSYNSLTMNGPVKLTQQPLAEGENTASNKLVNLNISGNLTMKGGAQINVSGMGYKGAYVSDIANCNWGNPGTLHAFPSNGKEYGWGPVTTDGPGGGIAYDNSTTSHHGGGGGFGGDGDRLPADTGGKKNPIAATGWEYGSGGGGEIAQNAGDTQDYNGGSGGGAVLISAKAGVDIDSSSHIYADGGDAAVAGSCSDGMPSDKGSGGGGAGGYIGIFTPIFNSTPVTGTSIGGAVVDVLRGSDGASDGVANAPTAVLSVMSNLSAKGGLGVGTSAFGGGGGIITVASLDAAPVLAAPTNGDNTTVPTGTGNGATADTPTSNSTGNTPVNNSTSGTWAQTGVTNGSTSTTSLAANLVASPATGAAPLTGVQLTATVANITAGTTINYTFYCDLNTPDITMPNTALLDKILATSNTIQTAGATCNYAVAGTYHPKVVVENGSQPSVYTIIPISVTAGAAAVVAPTTTTPAVTTTRTVAIKNGYFSSGNDDWNISGKPYDSAYAAGSCSSKDPCFRMQRNQLFAANDSARAIWQDIGALNQGKSYTVSLWSKHAIWYNSTGRLKLIDTTANQVVAEIDLSGSYRTWINSSASFTPNDSNYTHNYQVRIESDSGFRRYTGLLVDDIVIQER